MGWYIDQKVGYDELKGERAAIHVKEEIIEDNVKINDQHDTNYYPQPLQTPYMTNAMNNGSQPYYHLTPAHNYSQRSDKAQK